MKEGKSEWTLSTLKKYFDSLIKSNDKRYEQEFDNQKLAVKDALAAQKELTNAAFASSEKAIVKAEDSQRTYNAGHNDLSRKMETQYSLMVPDIQHKSDLKAIEEKIESFKNSVFKQFDNVNLDIRGLRESRSETGGKGIGTNAMWGYILGMVGILSLLFTIYKAFK